MTAYAPTREELREFFAEELEMPTEVITCESEFGPDLGIDSLAAMEIMVQLEKRYGIRLQEDEFAELTSVNAVHAFLSARLGTAPA